MAQQAQDTFVADMKDGSTRRVMRGEVFPDNHPLVKLDGGRGLLFRPLDLGDEQPTSSPRVPRAKTGKAI